MKSFHSGERIQKVKDSHAGFARYMLTEGEEKLRVQIYRDRICVDGVLIDIIVNRIFLKGS